MRFLRRGLTGVFLMALTLGLLAWAAQVLVSALEARGEGGGPGRPAEERVFAVRAVAVEPGTERPVLTAFGELRAPRTLEIRAPAAGRVVDLAPGFVEGGAVRAGERLLAIDPAEAETALARAREAAAEAAAEAADAAAAERLAAEDVAAAAEQLALRERALTRARDLSGRGVGTEAGVETAELAASSGRQALVSRRQAAAAAEARVAAAGAGERRAAIDLAEAERRLAELEIFAAFGGILSDVSVTLGGLVSPSEPLARLVDPRALEASFTVSAEQYARLVGEGGSPVGAPVEIALGPEGTGPAGAGLVATGTVTREAAEVGEGRTGRLLFAALEPAPALRPGDFVTVRVAEPPLEAVARLPAAALGAGGTVLLIGEEGRLVAEPVELLRRQGDEVLVRAPALAGRQVVAERSPLLGAGIRVRVIEPEAAAEAPAGAAADLAEGGAAPVAAPAAAPAAAPTPSEGG